MHIVEIPSFFPPYGGEFCLEQSRALQARGHEVRVVSNVQLSVKRSIREFLTLPYGKRWTEQQGIAVLQSYQRGVPKVVRPNVERWVTIVRSLFRDYVARYGKPDVLHAHCAKWAGYAAMLIGEEYGLPYIVTEHMPVYNYREELGPEPGTGWQLPLLKATYERAQMVVSVSEEQADDLSGYFGRDYRRTFISNVIDTEFFYFRERRRASGEPFRFVCPAIYTWRKGYDVLLAAFDRMKYRQVELHVAGSGTEGATFQRLLSTCGAADRVVTHGVLDKKGIRELLWKSNAVALATRGEVQPLVLLEAMSTGIPYVSTSVVPRCERFEDAGIVVPVDDVDAFARAMDEIVEKAVDGRKLSERVRSMASAEVVGRQLEQVLSEAIERGASR